MTTAPQKGKASPHKKAEDKNRRVDDRREDDSKGYLYISMVGWICRREKKRRHSSQSG